MSLEASSYESAKTLRARVVGATGWTMVAHGSGVLLRFGGSLIMTRLLVPEMFGVMAIATVVMAITALLSDIGLRQAVIQSPRGDCPLLHNAAWTLQIIRGFVIWAVCLIVALALSLARAAGKLPEGSAFASDELPAVIGVLSISAAIIGFQSTKTFTASRNLDLKRLTQIELSGHLVGLVVMVTIGWLTRSIWAIVIGGLVTTLVVSFSSHAFLTGIRNRIAWDRTSIRELIGYGRWVLISSGLAVIATNGDRLLLGLWVDAGTLGLYVLALNLAMMFEDATGKLFSSVAMPALSEVARNEPDRVKNIYLRLRFPFDAGLLVAAGALFVFGASMVEILYDPRYAKAGSILQIISFGLVFARYGMNVSLFLALGVPKKLFSINFVRVLSLFLLVPLSHSLYGFQGALWAIALHRVPVAPVVFLLNREHNLNDFRYEILVLVFWPVGYLLGSLLEGIYDRL